MMNTSVSHHRSICHLNQGFRVEVGSVRTPWAVLHDRLAPRPSGTTDMSRYAVGRVTSITLIQTDDPGPSGEPPDLHQLE